MCPETTGLAEEMLGWLDQKVKMLGEELANEGNESHHASKTL